MSNENLKREKNNGCLIKLKEEKWMKPKQLGYILVIALWVLLTFLCLFQVIVFDISTISGAIVAGLGLTFSIVGALRLLKKLYDGIYSDIIEDESSK
jgi:hypothetical protein